MSLLEALNSGVRVHSPAAMEALGRGLVREVVQTRGLPACVALYGDLGVGKTTLVRGMAAELQLPSLTSPSFNYYFLYKGCVLGRTVELLHLDAYRLSSPEDFYTLMLDEILNERTLWIIEWPERLGVALPKNALKIELKILSEGVHSVQILSEKT